MERAGENEGNGKGWYVMYFGRDPEVISKQEQVKKLKKMEERERRMESQRIQRIIEQNQRMNKIKGNEYEVSGLQKQSDSEKITFGFKLKSKLNEVTATSMNSWLINGIIVKVKEGNYVEKKGVVKDFVGKRGKCRGVLRLLK